MRSLDEIVELLPLLENQMADDLEEQDLDFKQWDLSSMNKSVSLVVKMAICFANGGGGTVVFGVADKVIGRSKAILGVPGEVDINLLKQTVYNKTDPKITPVLKMEQHELIERGGTGRGTYWTLKPKIHELLAALGHPERDRRIDWEAAKARIISILMKRSKRKESGITNKEIRQVTHYNRQQVTRLINQLRKEHVQIQIEGHGAGAHYIWQDKA